jgi:hypothetical protein
MLRVASVHRKRCSSRVSNYKTGELRASMSHGSMAPSGQRTVVVVRYSVSLASSTRSFSPFVEENPK